MSATAQRTSSIFCLLYHFICSTFAQYNMAGINLIDQNDFRVLNFGPVTNDKAIEKSIFVAYEGKTRKQCIWACSSSPGCVAYNYGSNGGICQLSNDTSPCALISKPGFVHQGVANFRECYKVFGVNVSVTSNKIGEFVVNGTAFPLEGHGNNFLAVHKDGRIHGNVETFDMAHGDVDAFTDMNAYIHNLPNDVIVLMAVVHDNHLSASAGVGSIPLLGSRYSNADLVGNQWWALIGYKGTRQPWITEAIESTTPVTRSVITYTLF